MTAGSSWWGGGGDHIAEMRARARANHAKYAISNKLRRGGGGEWR